MGNKIVDREALKALRERLDDRYVIEGEFSPDTTVGKALAAQSIISDREIEDSEIACTPIIFGPTGDGAEISDGISQFEYLEGNSEKWNQLVQNGNFADTAGWVGNNLTISCEDNVLTGIPTGSNPRLQRSSHFYTYANHKYYITVDLKCSSNRTVGYRISGTGNYDQWSITNTWKTYSDIFNAATNGNAFNLLGGGLSIGDTIYVRNLNFMDLTEIYGVGNEPTTVEEFKLKYPLDYYPYNPSSIISSKSYSLISKGKNQFEGLDTFTRVLPNTEYELSGITAGGYIQEYDANKNLIQTSTEITTTTNITLSANTYYVKIQATTYSNIMFYIAYETYNARYVGPVKQTIQLPNIELRSVGDVRDIAYATGGGYRKVGYDTVANIPQFNQVIGNVETQTTDYGITITNNGDGSYTFTGQNTSEANKYVSIGFNYGGSVPSGHKIFYQINSSNVGIGLANAANGKGLTYTNNISTTDDIFALHFRIDIGLDATNGITVSPFVIDLTELYGIGNEPLTVENFKTIFPNNYYSSKLATANTDGSVKCYYGTADYIHYVFNKITPTEIPLSENPGWNSDILVNNYGTLEFTTNPTQLPQVKQPYLIKYSINLVEFTDSTYVRSDGDANNLVVKKELGEVIKDIESGAIISGLSENFNTNLSIDDDSSYLFRTSGGSLEITNNCRLENVVGGSIVMNQLARPHQANAQWNNVYWYTRSSSAENTWDFVIGDNSLLFTKKATTTSNQFQLGMFTKIKNIPALYSMYVENNLGFDVVISFTYDDYTIGQTIPNGAGKYIFGICSRNHEYISVNITSGAQEIQQNATILIKNYQVSNLAIMFGTQIADYIYSLEQATAGAGVALVKQFLPKDYYEYTATPYFINVKTSGKKIVGFNAYNPTNGIAKLLGGNQYQITGTYTSLSYINILGNTETITPDANGKFTPTSNGTLTVAGGNATDTCVHLVWDGERDGEFEQYRETTYPIDDVELRGIIKLDSNNRLYNDGDKYRYNGSITRRYGIVDLGELSWVKNSTSTPNAFSRSLRQLVAKAINLSTAGNLICSKYVNIDYNHFSQNNKVISLDTIGDINIRDEDYTNYTADQVADALSGVYLIYELAIPTSTETADAFTEDQIVNNWGTEQLIDTRDIKVPVGSDTEYLSDLKAKLEAVPDNPENNGYYVLKRENGINSYYDLSSFLTDNHYVKKEEIATTNLGTITIATIVSNSFYRNNIAVSGGVSAGDIVFVQMSNNAVYPTINNNATQLVIFNGSDLSALTITKAWKVK